MLCRASCAAFLVAPLFLVCLVLAENRQDQACGSGQLSELFDLRFHNRFTESLPGERAEGELLHKPRDVHNAFWAQAFPTALSPSPQLVAYSEAAAEVLAMKNGAEKTDLFRQFVSGETLLEGGFAYAHCYGGHQFGYWAGQLGDGRAINLGEVVSGNGTRLELQLKGSGRTAFSRSGDGRAVLRSSLREFIASEFMAAVGVPTSRALSLAASETPNVVRDQFYDGNHQKEPGAIVLRMAPTWIRFGTFEIFASRSDWGAVKQLADFVIEHLYAGLQAVEGCRYKALLVEVARRTGVLFARWQSIGFVHGVLNTDNMSILGITIDYGPFAFLDAFNPTFTPNTSDDEARYSFLSQPDIGAWNVERLGMALTGILAGDQAEVSEAASEAVAVYAEAMRGEYRENMLGRLRIRGSLPQEEADGLVQVLMVWMSKVQPDTHNTLSAMAALQQRWQDAANAGVTQEEEEATRTETDANFVLGHANVAGTVGPEEVEELEQWLQRLKQVVLREVAQGWTDGGRGAGEVSEGRLWGLQLADVLYVPRNYLMHEAIEAAAAGDLEPLQQLKQAMLSPKTRLEPATAHDKMASPPPAWAERRGVKQLSCSS